MSPPPGRTGLYRIRDEAAALIYIGVTNGLPFRWNQHQTVQPWWDEVRSLTIEYYDTRAEALTAEKAAIEAERPKYNKTYLVPRKQLMRQDPLVPAPWVPSVYAHADNLAGDDGPTSLQEMARYWRATPAEMDRMTRRGTGPLSFCGTGMDRKYRPVDLKIWMAGHLQGGSKDPVSNNPVTGPCIVADELKPAVRAFGFDRKAFDPETPEGRDEIWDAYVACVRWLSARIPEMVA